MGWEDRPYYRDRRAWSNPLMAIFSGSVPLFTAFGIRVRVHSTLIVFILWTLLLDWWTQGYTLQSRLVSMGLLFGVVLLHEYGHCFAARMVGGTSEDILLWPFGGLAFSETPHRPGARFWMVAGGPLVNVAICIVSAAAVWALTPTAGMRAYRLMGHAWPPLNPFHPLPPPGVGWHDAAFYFWWLFVTSYLLFLFNLLPIFPLDGGQIVQTALWKAVGYQRSMMISTAVGMAGCGGFALFGLLTRQLGLVVLAAMLFYMAYRQRLMLKEVGAQEPWQTDAQDFSSSLYKTDKPVRRRRSKRAIRAARKRVKLEALERERIDGILAKVSAHGLHSLTWWERHTLHKATDRQRKRDLELKSL